MKEETIRPADLLEKYLKLCREDASLLLTDPSMLEAGPCPACGSAKTVSAFRKWGFEYHTCVQCDSLFMNPRPKEAHLQRFYDQCESSRFWASDYYPRTITGRREPVYRKRAEWLRDFQNKNGLSFGSILDVGCGFGVFLEELFTAFPASRILGLEPGFELAREAAKSGATILPYWLEDPKVPEAAGRVDCVTLFEVMEHFHAPKTAIRKVKGILKPGGILYFTTLCRDGFDIRVLGGDHKNVYPPCHINIMSLRGFGMLLQEEGFNIIEACTPGKLDVEIVKRSGRWEIDANGFLTSLVFDSEQSVLDRFQDFLSANKLSSHLWIAARLDRP